MNKFGLISLQHDTSSPLLAGGVAADIPWVVKVRNLHVCHLFFFVLTSLLLTLIHSVQNIQGQDFADSPLIIYLFLPLIFLNSLLLLQFSGAVLEQSLCLSSAECLWIVFSLIMLFCFFSSAWGEDEIWLHIRQFGSSRRDSNRRQGQACPA